ncbi:MAG TPA: HAD hydrolase-like protein [Thermoplasmata archaeon]|nr:HAD hydrolase-like protein [Thermoplasmata archaeon]
MARAPVRDRGGTSRGPPTHPTEPSDEGPAAIPPTSQFAEVSRGVGPAEGAVAPRTLERGLVVFDLDGTLLDDLGLIGDVAGEVLHHAFGTPAEEARRHYLATTGMPFEAQLAQLFPDVPAPKRSEVARLFHQRKIAEAYKYAAPFPEIPRVLSRLTRDGWTLAVSTGAEREMADLVLEREGLRYWFDGLLGSAQGTKREHLAEFRRRYPAAPIFLIGDSRFAMEAARDVPGVVAVGRASSLKGWTLTPDDLTRWGARWADYGLGELPEVLPRLLLPAAPGPSPRRRRPTKNR